MKVRELAQRVVEMTGTRSSITFRPLPVDDPRRRRPDIALAKKVLGWEPRVSLDVGLEKTIEHFMAVAKAAVRFPLMRPSSRRRRSQSAERHVAAP
jgi:UDP-glucuronate decarboxylase